MPAPNTTIEHQEAGSVLSKRGKVTAKSITTGEQRILKRGGMFFYAADRRPGYEAGRLRLVYEANPIAFLCEQAGGAATDGLRPILDIPPAELHQHTPLVFGSREEVETFGRYLSRAD